MVCLELMKFFSLSHFDIDDTNIALTLHNHILCECEFEHKQKLIQCFCVFCNGFFYYSQWNFSFLANIKHIEKQIRFCELQHCKNIKNKSERVSERKKERKKTENSIRSVHDVEYQMNMLVTLKVWYIVQIDRDRHDLQQVATIYHRIINTIDIQTVTNHQVNLCFCIGK